MDSERSSSETLWTPTLGSVTPTARTQDFQDNEIEVPSDVTPDDDSLCRTPPAEQQDAVVPKEATPPPAPPPPQSRMEQLLEQFLAYESSLSMPDYIKRFYVRFPLFCCGDCTIGSVLAIFDYVGGHALVERYLSFGASGGNTEPHPLWFSARN